MTHSHLDISRLEKVRRSGNKITARCPACAEHGGDRGGNHLAIYPSGKFGCAALAGDHEHRQRIFALVGVKGERDRDPARVHAWHDARARERREARARHLLTETARATRNGIATRYCWQPADIWEDSPQRIDCDLVETDPRHFLASLFKPDALLWTGNTNESGCGGRFSNRWRTSDEWSASDDGVRVGPMVTPAIWKPMTTSRSSENVACAPYVVLDFDGFDGIHPSTPEELQRHLHTASALIRWLREQLFWKLAAVVSTGGKSVHAWFHTPTPEVLDSLKTAAIPFGLDPGLIGRPEHPCRLPGHAHSKTGNLSRVLWLRQSES